jgi:hypothetical protein
VVTLGFEYLVLFPRNAISDQKQMIKDLEKLDGQISCELLTDRVIRVRGYDFDNSIHERQAINIVKLYGMSRTMTYHKLVGNTTPNLLKNEVFMEYVASLPGEDTSNFVNLVIGSGEYNDVFLQYFITRFDEYDPKYNAIFPMFREIQKHYGNDANRYQKTVNYVINNMTSKDALLEAKEMVDNSQPLIERLNYRINEL